MSTTTSISMSRVSRLRPTEHRRSLRKNRLVGALFLLTSSVTLAAAGDLSDVDIEGITKAAAEFYKGPPSQISGGSERCTYTAETECSLEVHLTMPTEGGVASLTVSKLDGVWKVGRWQRELVAFNQCMSVMKERHRARAVAGDAVSHEQYFDDQKKCYGPSGHVGGMRR